MGGIQFMLWPAILTSVAVCTFATTAAGQSIQVTQTSNEPRIEVAIGLTLQAPADVNVQPACAERGLPCSSPRTFPDVGLIASVARDVVGPFAIVGELSGYDYLWHSSPTREGKENDYVRSALAGARLHAPHLHDGPRHATKFRLFGQVLVGGQWSDITPSRRAVQPGAGVDFRLRRGQIVRLEYDYCSAPGTGRNLSGSRVALALGYQFGSDRP